VIDCSGRLSELGGVINLVDLRRWNLSRSERHLSVAKMICRSKSPEFGTKFNRKVLLFCTYLNFLITLSKEAFAPETSSIRPSILIEQRLVTDRHTDTGP